MYDFLWRQLEKFARSSDQRALMSDWSLFPALTILSRLYPSHSPCDSNSNLAPFLPPLLCICLSSPILNIRQSAATALASISDSDDLMTLSEIATNSLDFDKLISEPNSWSTFIGTADWMIITSDAAVMSTVFVCRHYFILGAKLTC